MAKGKSTWKYNKLLTGRRNYFDGTGSSILERQTPSWYITSPSPSPTNNMGIVVGGYTNNPTIIQPGTSTIKDVVSQIGTSSPSTSKFELSDLGKNILKGAGVAAAQIGGGLIGGGLQSGAGTAIQGLTPLTAALPPGIREAASAGLGLVGGLANRMFGSKLNQENIAKVENNINELNSFQSNALDFDTLSQNWSNAVTGLTFDDNYIGKDGWFSNKAKNKARDLRDKVSIGNTWVQNTLANNANNITNTQMQNLLGNYAAFGGSISRNRKYEDGGDLGLDGMIKARIALDSHFGNPTARRMTNYDTRSYTFPDGEKGNVYVSSYDNYVTPHIQDVDGELKFIEEPWNEENWRRSEAQSMKFENPKDAKYFGENYKKFAPMMSLYAKGGRLHNSNSYKVGQVYEISEEEYNRLIKEGYGVTRI